MRICGEATSVSFPGHPSIRVGGTVARLTVHIECALVYVVIETTDKTTEYHTFVNREVDVQWASEPNRQSISEWTMWLANNAVQHLSGNQPKPVAPSTPEHPAPATRIITSSPVGIDSDAGGPEGFDRS